MLFNCGTTGLRNAYHWLFSEFRLVPIKHSLSGAPLLSYNPLKFFDCGTRKLHPMKFGRLFYTNAIRNKSLSIL